MDLITKKSKYYGVKTELFQKSVQDIDTTKRTVQFIGNTYLFMDSDGDVLLPGCCKRSIDQRGPKSKAIAKIKHQHDHYLTTEKAIGKITDLKEQNYEENSVLYCESFIPATTKGNDDLINYQSGVYDNHSIGYRYIDIVKCAKEDPDESIRANWGKYYPLIINPEVADKMGMFWAVKEIELFEISTVSFGANALTPYLGSKSETKQSQLLLLNNRLDLLSKQLSSGKQSDDCMKDFELQTLQIKQIISELLESSEQGTLKDGSPKLKSSDFRKLTICSNCGLFFDSYGMEPDDDNMVECVGCGQRTDKNYPGVIKSELNIIKNFKFY